MKPETLSALVGLYLSSATRGPKAPRSLRLDSDGVPISLTVPGPGVLAEIAGLMPGGTFYRTGTSGVVDEHGDGVDVLGIRDALIDDLAALPDVPGAGEPYRALRLLFRSSSEIAPAYAYDVVKVWRRSLDKAPKPEPVKEPRPRRLRTPDVERKRASREQQRADEEESVRWFLAGWLAGRFTTGPHAGRPLPAGTRVPAPRLRSKAEQEIASVVEEFEEILSPEVPGGPPEPDDFPNLQTFRDAVEDYESALAARSSRDDRLAEWEEWADEDVLPFRPRVPRRSVFFEVADDLLGGRTRTRDGQVYTLPAHDG